mgnify:CR=1 FL=1
MTLRRPLALALALALTLPPASALAQQVPVPPSAEALSAASESKVPLDEIRRDVAVYKAVKQAYVEPVDDTKLMQSAIRGLLLDTFWDGWLETAGRLGCVALVCNHALWDAALPVQTGSPGEALRLGRRWLSHLEALLKG